MNQATKSILKSDVLSLAVVAGLVMCVMAEPAFAQASGGIDKVNTFVDNVLGVLRGVSVGVTTGAIMWAGYKFFFKNSGIDEAGKILGGGLAIGSASELAHYLIS